jgi:hypothetical protein
MMSVNIATVHSRGEFLDSNIFSYVFFDKRNFRMVGAIGLGCDRIIIAGNQHVPSHGFETSAHAAGSAIQIDCRTGHCGIVPNILRLCSSNRMAFSTLVALPGLEPGRLAARDFHTTSAFAAPEGFVVWTVPSPSRPKPP